MISFSETQAGFFLLHLASCALMTGVIWVVQLILYPAFAQVNAAQFNSFHRNHSQKITYIVGPVMITELVTSTGLVYFSQDSVFFIFNLLAVVLIWLCTFFLSVPLHAELEKRSDPQRLEQLVKTNWPRTLLWSFRLVCLVGYSLSTLGALHVYIH